MSEKRWSEWFVTANPNITTGEYLYTVVRKDLNAPIEHSGTRQYADFHYTTDKAEAQAYADKLNAEAGDGSDV